MIQKILCPISSIRQTPEKNYISYNQRTSHENSYIYLVSSELIALLPVWMKKVSGISVLWEYIIMMSPMFILII